MATQSLELVSKRPISKSRRPKVLTHAPGYAQRPRNKRGANDEFALRAAYDAHAGELLGFAYNKMHDRQAAFEGSSVRDVSEAWRHAAQFPRVTRRIAGVAIQHSPQQHHRCQTPHCSSNKAGEYLPELAQAEPGEVAAPDDSFTR